MRRELSHLLYPVVLGVVVGSALLFVGGCGQSGRLYLPEPDQDSIRSAKPDADADRKSDDTGGELGTPSADQTTEPPQTTTD